MREYNTGAVALICNEPKTAGKGKHCELYYC